MASWLRSAFVSGSDEVDVNVDMGDLIFIERFTAVFDAIASEKLLDGRLVPGEVGEARR